jgi:hypothetical protein
MPPLCTTRRATFEKRIGLDQDLGGVTPSAAAWERLGQGRPWWVRLSSFRLWLLGLGLFALAAIAAVAGVRPFG